MNEFQNSIVIFTDGASRGNPGPGGWGAIIVIQKSKSKDQNEKVENDGRVIELGGREDETTNNRMELTAAIEALRFIESHTELPATGYQLLIYTDSQYVINGVTRWLPAWIENQWRTKAKKAVANQDLWKQLNELAKCFAVMWKYVGGHVGIGGNERADQIATNFADNAEMTLENTSLSEYPIDILSVAPDASLEKQKQRSGNGSARRVGKAYSYVSMIGGEIKTHQRWDECKKRVHGKNAMFRKAMSKKEEKEIINEFKQAARR